MYFPSFCFRLTTVYDNYYDNKIGMRALRITPRLLLPEALLHFFNLLPPHPTEVSNPISVSIPFPGTDLNKTPTRNENENEKNVTDANAAPETAFEFNEVSYLKAKNSVDATSYSTSVRGALIQQLRIRIQQRLQHINDEKKIEKTVVVTVVDLGAGLLNMLQYAQKIFLEAVENISVPLELQYIAFESNKKLESETINMLTNELGFVSIPSNVPLTSSTVDTINSDVKSFRGRISSGSSSIDPSSTSQQSVVITVHLISEDFMSNIAIKILKDLMSSYRCSDDDTSAIGTGIGVNGQGYCSQRFPIDLFIGCCVADLIPPKALAVQVVEMAGDEGGLLYLPITFCGATKIIRGERTEKDSGSDEKKVDDVGVSSEVLTSRLEGEGVLPVPTDIEVFGNYHDYLSERGHHLSTDRLLKTLEAYGCTVIAGDTRQSCVIRSPSSGSSKIHLMDCASNWKISKRLNPYMWNCMMRFIALGTVSQFLGKYDLKSWFNGVEKNSKDCHGNMLIEVSNIDILTVLPEVIQKIKSPNHVVDLDSSLCTEFGSPSCDVLKNIPSTSRMPSPHSIFTPPSTVSLIPMTRRSVEFLSPRNAHIIHEPVPTVGPNQILVRTSCSLVSTGTELKIFKGDLDSDQPADLTISGMEEKMTYPLRYGYSLVGTVVKVGERLNEKDWLDQLVFTFSPHSSAVVVDASSVIIVPKGISPEDAVFLPSVETAVSFVQAARINLGEKILVVGQGLIGMLTSAVISKMINAADMTVADISEKRLKAVSLFINNAKLWNPKTPIPLGTPFDLSIEVSGHPSGLQTAIDSTGTNGRIIIGSWYGEASAPLKLGLKFHRSGLQLITSQVSTIPPELTGRWDKKRRFNLSWEAIRRIKPSSLISSIVPLNSNDVLNAYIRLDKGEEVTVLFKD